MKHVPPSKFLPRAARGSVWRKVVAAALLTSGLAFAAPSTTIVISQIYGAGGNSGATYNSDFVELHNISNSTVSLSGWSLQYASATGSSWTVGSLTGSIPAGGYFLVRTGNIGTNGVALPSADTTISGISMAATAGKIALANNTTALTGTNPSGGATIIDFAGFGTTANGFEGTGPTPAPSTTNAAVRKDFGSQDTDQNANDFLASAVSPRNSASTPYLPGDTAAPTISTLTPANNASGVAIATNLVVDFNEPVSKGTGNLTVKLVSDNSTVFTIPVTDSAVAVSSTTATVTLPSALSSSTGYYVNIDAGTFKDAANNNFAGIADTTTWTFTTGVSDSTPPSLATVSPADDSTTAFPNGILSATFSEDISAGSGSLVIKKISDDSVVESITVPSAQVIVSGAAATINPASVLGYGTGYYIEIAAGTFKDGANNGNLAVTGNSTWNFTTRSLPQVLISQYYEGTSSDRYIELKNTTGSPVALDGYQLAAWSDTPPSDNEGWKTGTNTSLRITDLTGYSIPANGSFLVADIGASLPEYAANSADLVNPITTNGTSTSFNGDDSVVLYQGTGFTQEEVVDAVSFTGNQGTDISIYRISNTQQGFDFVSGTSYLSFPGTWATKTLAEVSSASPSDDWFLKASQPPKYLSLSISPNTFSEGAGPSAATGTITVASPVESDLYVVVTSSDPSEATVADTAMIPSGQTSTTFPIDAVNDAYLDGDKTVSISIAASSYVPDSKSVTVQDQPSDPSFPVVINEVDADQTGTDSAEFIELYNTSSSPISLDGVIVVLYNGSNDLSYSTIDLTGHTIGANDFFVIGSASVPNVDKEIFVTDGIQNGADAVALYLAAVGDFPNNTPVTTTAGTLVDALVYDTADADDTGLINALTPTKPQVDEDGTSSASTVSMSRVPDGGAHFETSLYALQTPTPGLSNVIAGYSSWASTNSTAQTIDLDHDGDGVSNGVEYFLGGNTNTTGFTATPGVVNNAGTLSVTWTKAADYAGAYGADFVVETSTTLSGAWTPETLGVNVTITGNDVKYTFPAGTKNFARLKVTGP